MHNRCRNHADDEGREYGVNAEIRQKDASEKGTGLDEPPEVTPRPDEHWRRDGDHCNARREQRDRDAAVAGHSGPPGNLHPGPIHDERKSGGGEGRKHCLRKPSPTAGVNGRCRNQHDRPRRRHQHDDVEQRRQGAADGKGVGECVHVDGMQQSDDQKGEKTRHHDHDVRRMPQTRC